MEGRGGEDKDRTWGRKVPVNFRIWKAVLCFPCLHSRAMSKLTKQRFYSRRKYRGQRISSLQISEIDGFEEEPSSPTGDDSLIGDSNPR